MNSKKHLENMKPVKQYFITCIHKEEINHATIVDTIANNRACVNSDNMYNVMHNIYYIKLQITWRQN